MLDQQIVNLSSGIHPLASGVGEVLEEWMARTDRGSVVLFMWTPV